MVEELKEELKEEEVSAEELETGELSDEEAEKLRSVCYGLARLAMDCWRTKNKKEFKPDKDVFIGENKNALFNGRKQSVNIIRARRD